PPRRLHLAVANRTGWFVGADDDAKIADSEVDGAHRHREDPGVEQAATGAEHQGKRHQAEAVHQLVLHQRLEQVSASPDLQLVARFVPQPLYCGDDVAGHQASGIRCSPRHMASASLSELDTTYLGSELIAVAMVLAGSV